MSEDISRELLTSWILSTEEAQRARHLIASEEEMAGVCNDSPDLSQQMAASGLSASEVARQMYRTEWLKATLGLAVAEVEPPSETEVRSYYERYPERWLVPETRRLSHILITVQDGYAENSEEAAKERIFALAARLGAGESFEDLATRYSECPTALEGGSLGALPAGQLFPELEELARELGPEQVSVPVRSQMGYHLLKCHEIQPERYRTFEELREKLSDALLKKRRLIAQQRWVQSLAEDKKSAS